MYRRLGILLVSIAVAIPVIHLCAAPPDGRANAQKAILVTGASTGIGRKITERLAADGYFVYAGARKDSDLKALSSIRNVQAIRLDVTRPEEIAAAVSVVRQGGRGLYGLVNNAGIGTASTVVGSDDKEFDRAMAVNVYGPYRVTKAFAPLVMEQKGRITTIGSIFGVVTMATASAYSMSKHALEAFTDTLAQEMAPHGVLVSIVEPGNYNSQISKNAVERLGADPHIAADRSMFPEPDDVAIAVEDALFAAKPKRRYLVCPNAKEAEVVIRKQIDQLVQLNEGQRYTYDRTALIKMLDESLQGARPRAAH